MSDRQDWLDTCERRHREHQAMLHSVPKIPPRKPVPVSSPWWDWLVLAIVVLCLAVGAWELLCHYPR